MPATRGQRHVAAMAIKFVRVDALTRIRLPRLGEPFLASRAARSRVALIGRRNVSRHGQLTARSLQLERARCSAGGSRRERVATSFGIVTCPLTVNRARLPCARSLRMSQRNDRRHHHVSGRAVKPARSSIASPALSTPCSSSALADDLQAERQALAVEPAGHRHRRQAGEAGGDREHVVEVHRQRIGDLLAEREGGASARSG